MKTFLRHAALVSLCAASATVLAEPKIEASGGANIDADFAFESRDTKTSTGSPLLPTPSVSVADELPGTFRYAALSDSTVPKMQIYGYLNNTESDSISGSISEIPYLFANAKLRDTVFLTAPSSKPYTVTAEMVIDGTLDVDGSNGRVTALLQVSPVGKLSKTEDRTYDTNASIDGDILPISYTFTGDANFDISAEMYFFVTQINEGTEISADFSHTAVIRLILTGEDAASITLSSSSGYFATQPVPLPGALPMLLSALIGLGVVRRRVG